MRLSEREREIVAMAQLRADRPLAEIARAASCREATVRGCIERLSERKVLHRRACINPYRLGYFYFEIFFCLSASLVKRKDELISFLCESPYVSYLTELGGEYHYSFDICTKSSIELVKFFDTLNARFGEPLNNKTFSQIVSLTDYSNKFLCGRNFNCDSVTLGMSGSSGKPVVIDALDHKILKLISGTGIQRLRALQEQLKVPATTVDYRLRRLEREGILLGSRYLIDMSQLNYQSYIHLVYVRNSGAGVRAKLAHFCRVHPNIYYWIHHLGSWDFEIGTTVERAQDVHEVTRSLYSYLGDEVVRVQTIPLLKFYKVSNYPFGMADEDTFTIQEQ